MVQSKLHGSNLCNFCGAITHCPDTVPTWPKSSAQHSASSYPQKGQTAGSSNFGKGNSEH